METPIIKKSRSLPRVWKRFYQLKKGETFFSRTDVVAKDSVLPIAFDGVKVLWPWTRVRTTTLVRDVLPGGKKGPEPIQPSVETLTILGSLNKPFPRNAGQAIKAPRYDYDHSIGDACLPGDDKRSGPSA